MKNLPSESVDAVVTDPPYGLSNHTQQDIVNALTAWLAGEEYEHGKKGFMGKEWDSFVPSPTIWREVWRVLKPGAHVLCASGTRTVDLMGISLRLAGFEIRDTIEWLYGCLSEDTEILTKDGFKRYHKNILHDSVLCYNLALDSFEFHKPTRVFNYENQHTAYRIKSDFTDQIVSRNHRCLVERKGKLVFVSAEALQSKENIPFLESVSKLQQTFPDVYKRTGYQKQNLFKGMRGRSKFIKQKRQVKTTESIEKNASGLCCMWEGIYKIRLSSKKSGKSDMFKEMQRGIARSGLEKTRSQRAGELETRKRVSFKRAHDWREKSILEGRFDGSQSQREICQSSDKVCQMPDRIYQHGTKRRLCNGASLESGYSDKQTFNSYRVRSPYQSRCYRQSNREFNIVCNKSRTQEIRGRSEYKTTLATVTPIEYQGNVWCVEVPTGAFVARRNGKIFITGNSGFPKSLSIDKAIDREAGIEREVVGSEKLKTESTKKIENASSLFLPREWDITAPATEAAKQWQGFGTALKPAHEPFILARKPIEKGLSIAENCLKWGTGALDIDGCRVATNDNTSRIQTTNTPKFSGIYHMYNSPIGFINKTNNQGRFPANVIHDGSECVVSLFPDVKSGGGKELKKATNSKNWGMNAKNDYVVINSIKQSDGSAARFFYCAKASPSERNTCLDNLEDVSCGCLKGRKDGSLGSKVINKNHHPTVKPIRLMEYLTKLISRENQVVLDPFMGSGTTGIACRNLNRQFIGIEIFKEYYDIAYQRIHEELPPVELSDGDTSETLEKPQPPKQYKLF